MRKKTDTQRQEQNCLSYFFLFLYIPAPWVHSHLHRHCSNRTYGSSQGPNHIMALSPWVHRQKCQSVVVGCLSKETLFTSAKFPGVFTGACCDSISCAGHHLLCLLLMAILATFFYYFFIESHGTRLSEHPGLQREDHHYVSPSVCPCVDSWWWRLWPELSQAREAVGTLRRATETWTIWDLTRSQVMLTALIILVLTRPANCSIYSAGQSMRATPSKREIYIYIYRWSGQS